MGPLWSREGFSFCSGIGQDPTIAEHGNEWVLRDALAKVSSGEIGHANRGGRPHRATLEGMSKGYGEVNSLEGGSLFLIEKALTR